jgi:2-polyprenyl-6-methoxyphenol hydroxylase-like FAD-dependent oxidoreductase
MRLPFGALDAVAAQGEQELRAAILRYFDGWAPQLRALISAPSTSGFVVRPMWVLPCGLEWDVAPGGRATLLGDAAHPMTTFAGLGANLAMADGADLGLALAEAKTPAELVVRVREYETAMRRRSREGWERSMVNMDAFFSDGAPATAVEKWKEQMRTI